MLTDVAVYALRQDEVLQLAHSHADFHQYLQAAALKSEYRKSGQRKGGGERVSPAATQTPPTVRR